MKLAIVHMLLFAGRVHSLNPLHHLRMISSSPPKRQKRTIVSSHFHCYLLNSLDPNHPVKTYVGFTTDPHRRIRQHNGVLKAGGARRTRRSGRPWQFACIVHGFQTQRAGLQFEWAWQHCDKSIAVRSALGDQQAKKLKSKRGVFGQLSILKTLVTECEDTYVDASDLTIYFFDEKTKASFEKIKLESGLDLPERVRSVQVGSLEEMLFWKDRGNKKQSHLEEEEEIIERLDRSIPLDCILCSRPIQVEEQFVACPECLRQMHGICSDVHSDEGDGLCPRCDALIDRDGSSFESEEFSSDEDDTDPKSSQITRRLQGLRIYEHDDLSIDSFDELLAPPKMEPRSTTERATFESLDNCVIAKPSPDGEILYLSDTDDSFMKVTPLKTQQKNADVVCWTTDDSVMEISPPKRKQSEPSRDSVIDLCSP